jgi:[ribosomal protein S5]-alanine N-acetyltransferase
MNLSKIKIILKVKVNLYLKTIQDHNVSKKYINWLNTYEITKFTEQKNYKHNYTNVKNYVSKKFLSNNDILFGIIYKKKHIGNIKLSKINYEHKSCEVSFFIGDEKFWGKRIATNSLKKVVSFAINKLNMKKINAGYYENNFGSAKVFNNCNFKVEGIKKKQIIFENKRIDGIIVGYTK